MTPETEQRQIVLLCDGTNNNLTGQHEDTNVVKLCALLAADADPRRLVFYDPGVGNPGELPGATTWDQFRRTLDRVSALAFGRGVYENMVESYLFVMRHYRPGDQIFIFGFSRGAFTARSVAGLVNLFGILRPHMESMLPTLLHVYFADRGNSPQWQAICDQTSRLFTNDDARRVDIPGRTPQPVQTQALCARQRPFSNPQRPGGQLAAVVVSWRTSQCGGR